jgi:hypothetical protein
MKRSLEHWSQVAIAGALLFGAGCSATNVGQLERCQADKKQLLSRVVEEQKRSESLTTELRSANQKLADAEKQLARFYDPSRGSLASAGGGLSSPAGPLARSGAPRGFSAGPEPIGAGVSNGGSGPGMMASGSSGSGSLFSGSNPSQPLAFGMPGGSASGNARANMPSPPASVSLDPSGFDQLAPLNGRSESGWMPKSAPRR